MGQAKRKGEFAPEMRAAMQENNDFIQDILSHSCRTAANVLCGASQIGIIAHQFAHEVDDEDPLRQESNDVSKALAQLIGRELQNKSPLAVANALFWAATKVAANSVDDCAECEEEFAKTTTTYTVN
jgi:hypothetical protein